jgi:hypothetical protein
MQDNTLYHALWAVDEYLEEIEILWNIIPDKNN